MPPFAAVMAHGTMPRPAPKLANGQTQLSLAITRWTRVRGHKSVPEFTANPFVDHHWRIGAVSICRPKSLNSLGCSGGKASQTTNFMGSDKGESPDYDFHPPPHSHPAPHHQTSPPNPPRTPFPQKNPEISLPIRHLPHCVPATFAGIYTVPAHSLPPLTSQRPTPATDQPPGRQEPHP